MDIISWITSHAVDLVALLYAIEKVLELIGTLTGNKRIDNVGEIIGTWLKKIFPNQSPK